MMKELLEIEYDESMEPEWVNYSFTENILDCEEETNFEE